MNEDWRNELITKGAAVATLNEVMSVYIPHLYGKLEEIPLECTIAIAKIPPAQPYTDAEIQKKLDLILAKFEKMYQLGYEEGKQAVQAQGMKSRWFDGRCLRCGEHAPFHSMSSTYYKSNFCPNCGAWMLEEPYKGE